jgi:hypothetical protein
MSNLALSGNRKETRAETASLAHNVLSPRRQFLKSAVSLAAGISIAPYVITSQSRASSVLGTEEHAYEIHHQCVELPSKYNWQTTHNVAVDANNNLYVIHEGRANLKDHPSIFVFDENGKFIRAFGNQFQGGHCLGKESTGTSEDLSSGRGNQPGPSLGTRSIYADQLCILAKR